jgi:cell division protein FtsL
MNEVYINTINLPEWSIDKYFKDKQFYSIDELIGIIEDLDSEIERTKEEFEDYKQYVNDNYKFIDYV